MLERASMYTSINRYLIPPTNPYRILLLLGALVLRMKRSPRTHIVKLFGWVGILQLSCGDCPNLVCKGPVAAFKGTTSGITAPRIVWGREENTVALVASWGALCLHTALTETYFPSKGRNFGNTSSSPSIPLVVTSYLYIVQTLFVLYPLLACVVVVASII